MSLLPLLPYHTILYFLSRIDHNNNTKEDRKEVIVDAQNLPYLCQVAILKYTFLAGIDTFQHRTSSPGNDKAACIVVTSCNITLDFTVSLTISDYAR